MSVFRIPLADFSSAIIALLSRGNDPINVEFDDKERVAITPRRIIFHLFFWKVAREYNIPITKDLLIDTSIVNSDVVGSISTKILHLVREKHPSRYQPIVHNFEEAFNRLSKFVTENCQEHHRSLNILDLVRIAKIPEVRKITNDPLTDQNMLTKQGEKIIIKKADKLFTFLSSDHPDNNLKPFVTLRFVSPTQLFHIFGQIGYRTDINDNIISYPVQGNYLNGLRNPIEYALESLSAKKSIFYNKESIPLADYFGRKQHLLLSVLENIYPGDCGTLITLPILVTEQNCNSILWKNMVENGRIISIEPGNVKSYLGKTIKARTPLGCRHQDGVCEICAGRLLSNSIPNVQIGIYSAIQTTERIVQVILGSKHLQSTRTVDYTLPGDLESMMIKIGNGIFIKPGTFDKWKTAQLAFDSTKVMRLMNIPEHQITRTASINEASFGRVNEVSVMKNYEPITDFISMEINNQNPIFSRHFIKYISDNFATKTKISDGLFIIDLGGFDFEKPLFKTIVVNAAMVNFVKEVSALLENNLNKYTSGIELYNVFHDLVHSQVKVNSAYLEMVLRAAMITGEYDFRLPIVKDLDNVQFGTNENINRGRSVGVLTAFQTLSKELINVRFYLQPKQLVRFDHFLNLKNSTKLNTIS